MGFIILIYFAVGIGSAAFNLLRWVSPYILLPFLPVIATINIFFGSELQKKEALVIFKILGLFVFFPIIPFVSAYNYSKTKPFLAIVIFCLYSFLYVLIGFTYYLQTK